VVTLFGAPGQEHYSASKSALTSVMRGLAVELARFGIRSNALLPGWTETELTGEARTYEKFVTDTTNRTPVRRWATLHDFEAVGAYSCDPTITFHTGTRWSSTALIRFTTTTPDGLTSQSTTTLTTCRIPAYTFEARTLSPWRQTVVRIGRRAT
jgi:NAD(P)-dependent dehydrogenase (short-subunit alcohol dehydrogenase family)